MNHLRQFLCLCCIGFVTGCGYQPPPLRRGEKTRETVAEATERMKPEIEWSSRKIGEAAAWVADEAVAAAEGFLEGWTEASTRPIDLNSASERQLESLPGITHHDAQKIISARPYRGNRDLIKKHVISEAAYSRIKDRVTVN